MFEKQERIGVAVYLHYNRDARKLAGYGDILYHSKKLRYLLLYINQEQLEEKLQRLQKEKVVKSVLPSYVKDIDQQFVGSLE